MRTLNDLFTYNDADVHDGTRARKLLVRILVVYVALGLVHLGSILIFDPGMLDRLVISSVPMLVSLGLIYFVQRGYVRTVSWVIVIVLWVSTLVSFIAGGGVRAASYGVFLPVVLALFLLGRRVGLAIILLTIAFRLIVTVIEVNTESVIAPRVLDPMNLWVSQSLVILLIGLVIEMAVSSMQWAMGRAKSAETSWRTLAQNTPDIILEITPDGTIRFLNRAMTDLTVAAVIGKPLHHAVPIGLGPLLSALVVDVITTGKSARQLWTQTAASGKRLHHQIIATPVINEGMLEVISITIRDISGEVMARDQAAQLALETEKNAMLNTFISEMSHDFKSPLTSIMMSADLLARHTDPEKQREKVHNIQQQAMRLNGAIQNLLTMAQLDHITDITLMPFDLNALVRQIVREFDLLIGSKGLDCTTRLDDALPPARGDPSQVGHALANLLENAVRYTPEGGKIVVRTYLRDKQIVVDVIDTGIGIQPDDIERVFQRFYRSQNARSTEKSGTGLGLAIVRRVMQVHGGDVRVTSTPGSGSTFSLLFPVRPAREAAAS